MKKILIVSYHFPPDASVGALRPAKFAKYLPQFCWSPIILSVRDRYYSSIDKSKLKDVASVPRIYRTSMLPHASRIYVNLKTRFQKREAHTESDNTRHRPTKGGAIFSSPKRLFLSLECLPDDKQVWIPAATSVGLKIIVQEKVNAIYTSGPPMSCHLIGLLLKTATGRRWIADFRDPWISHRGGFVPSTAVSRAIEGWFEKKTIRNADRIVLATDRMQADLHQRYPDSVGKTTVILNGYDPPDFNDQDLARCRSDQQYFTLTHAGTIYYKRTAELFLVCLSRLIKSGQIPRTRVRVNFIGSSPRVQERCRQLEIDDVVRVVDTMDYQSCIQCLYRSDVLLLLAQEQPLQIPAKFYDYIAVRKPILVVAEDGATVDLARALGGPIVVQPDDPAYLETCLKKMYEQFERNALSVDDWNNEWIHRELTKVELTKKLVDVIN
jgi:glycosyltransferase involved in cell wall biosynthesis